MYEVEIEGQESLLVRCRTCLGPGLVGAVPLWEGAPPPAERLSTVAKVKTRPRDRGPQLLCARCLTDLDAACRFRERAEYADRWLHKLLEEKSPSPSHSPPPSPIHPLSSPTPSFKSNFIDDFKLESQELTLQQVADSFTIAPLEPMKSEHNDEKVTNDLDSIAIKIHRKKGRKSKLSKRKRDKDKSKIKNDLDCTHCPKTFLNSKSLKSHMKSHSKTREYTCDICGKQFKYRDNLKAHSMTHTGEKPFGCDLCEKNFSKKDNLAIHRKRHFKERNFNCEQCKSAYYTSYELKTHMRVHTGEKPYACTMCGKRFTAKSNLLIHQHTHTGEKPHICNVCGKHYASKNILAIHYRLHTGEKPYVCSVCGKRFAANKLAVHLRTHTGEKPHICSLCGMQFSTSNVLGIHMRRHTGEKPYECKICGQIYGHTQSLNKHMRKQHKISTSNSQVEIPQTNEEGKTKLDEVFLQTEMDVVDVGSHQTIYEHHTADSSNQIELSTSDLNDTDLSKEIL